MKQEFKYNLTSAEEMLMFLINDSNKAIDCSLFLQQMATTGPRIVLRLMHT